MLKNKRQLSPYEYEKKYKDIYNIFMKISDTTPKRKRYWLINPIFAFSNDIYYHVMNMIEESKLTDIVLKDKFMRKYRYVSMIVNDIKEIQKYLLSLWNIEHYKFEKMCYLANEINVFQTLILSSLKDKGCECISDLDVIESERLLVLNFDRIEQIEFLKIMSQLHKYSHEKVYHMKQTLRNDAAALIIQLVNNAFYDVIKANNILPHSRKEYLERRKYIEEAIKAMFEINRPLILCANVMMYSERTIKEWCKLICTEIKLLKGLLKSDKNRFSKLPNI